MNRIITCCLAAVVLVGCMKDKKETPSASASAAKAKPSYFEEQKQTLTATVESIDPKTRSIVLRGQEGRAIMFKVSDEVRNLEQVKVGDRVLVDYMESIAINVKGPGEPENEVRVAGERAEPGQKPGGMVAQHTTMTATVEAIDKKAGTATLRGPQGNVRTVTARDPKNLDNVNVGDRLVITHSETMAVSVRPAPAASGAPTAAPKP